jgi:uncharacterized membrane protein YfcA
MSDPHFLFMCLAVCVVAFLYSSVGHAGASGYIAVMTLFALPGASIKPIALVLNIMVAIIGTIQFWRMGYFSWALFWPFAVGAVPMAFVGGYVHLPTHYFKMLVGVVLLCSAVRLFWRYKDAETLRPVPRPVALGTGAGVGLLSGLTGTGGGIFLTPMLLFFRWARTKQAAAISAPFILVNSLSGLGGYVASRRPLPPIALALGVAAVAGGLLGSYLGSRRFPVRTVQLMLACVLVVAGLKLIFTH